MRELEAEVRRLLVGKRFSGVGRSLSMGVLEFADADASERSAMDPAPYALHLQCPFRLIRGSEIVLASGDISLRRSGTDDTYFDAKAELIDRAMGSSRVLVSGCTISASGDLSVALTDSMRIDAIVARSDGGESWRVLHRFHDHVAFPAEVR